MKMTNDKVQMSKKESRIQNSGVRRINIYSDFWLLTTDF